MNLSFSAVSAWKSASGTRSGSSWAMVFNKRRKSGWNVATMLIPLERRRQAGTAFGVSNSFWPAKVLTR
jgi:hypothetical protein